MDKKNSTKMVDEDPRIKKTREAIQQAFILLFYENRFNSITIANLMKKAGYSRAAFYSHYKNLWEVYEQVTAEYAEDLCRAAERDYMNSAKEYGQKMLLLETIQVIKKWHPFGKALIKRKDDLNLFQAAMEDCFRRSAERENGLYKIIAMDNLNKNEESAEKLFVRLVVAALASLFGFIADYIEPCMPQKQLLALIDNIYKGSTEFNRYISQWAQWM